MKTINNKRGSAILWCVLLTVIVTILLGSLLSAAYTYYNYTMYSVKKQQAYFTARSAFNALVEEFSNTTQKQVTKTTIDEDGKPVTYNTWEDQDPAILPDKGTITHITDFNFSDSMNMGTAEAWIARGDVKDASKESKSNDEANDLASVKVVAQYADVSYTLTSVIQRTPVEFAGVAIKRLTVGTNAVGKTLKLAENTDLYWNNDSEFNMSNYSCNFDIGGSLVTKGDAVIKKGTSIAGHSFDNNQNVRFSIDKSGGTSDNWDYSHVKKLWTNNEYIISNKTLVVFENDSSNVYTSSLTNRWKTLLNGTTKLQGTNNKIPKYEDYFGEKNWRDTVSGWTSGKSEFASILSDLETSGMSLEKFSTDANTINYIKVLAEYKYGFESMFNLDKKENYYNALDIYYIGYESLSFGSYADSIVPLTYLLVPDMDKNTRTADALIMAGSKTATNTYGDIPITVRVMYGCNPGLRSWSGKFIQSGKQNFDEWILTNVFEQQYAPSTVVVYLGKGETLELGFAPTQGTTLQKATAKEDGDLVFTYSVFGDDGSKLILHDGVTLIGEINVETLDIEGDVTIQYANTSGSQVAKQKVSEYWTAVKYSD